MKSSMNKMLGRFLIITTSHAKKFGMLDDCSWKELDIKYTSSFCYKCIIQTQVNFTEIILLINMVFDFTFLL